MARRDKQLFDRWSNTALGHRTRQVDVTRLQLADAELAYLSACSTAAGGRFHADESPHLAAACQLAGFRHVIGSLWPLADSSAAHAAHGFYAHLPDTSTADDAALALHKVADTLRAAHADRPDLWALFVHQGM